MSMVVAGHKAGVRRAVPQDEPKTGAQRNAVAQVPRGSSSVSKRDTEQASEEAGVVIVGARVFHVIGVGSASAVI